MKDYIKNKYIYFYIKLFILFIFISIKFYSLYLKNIINNFFVKNNEKQICESILDPIFSFNIRLKSEPYYLCKSPNSYHICYKNNLTYYWEKDGLLCIMKNLIINPSFWKEDGFIYNGPVNKKTRGTPLISKGFFNIKCNMRNKMDNYNKMYMSYLNSWNYINNDDINFKIEKELFPNKTIFIISRNQDSPNLFHGGSEFINAFAIMKILNLKPENIQILFLESMKFKNDPYYDLYRNIISGGNEPIHIRDLNSSYHISNAVHIPINWDSPCFTKCPIPKCSYPSLTYLQIYKSILKYMNLYKFNDSLFYNKEAFYYPKTVKNPNSTKYTKFLTFQWRRPWPQNRKNQDRLLGDGPDLVDKLSKELPQNILIRLVDTARLSYFEQILIMQKTDYFIGIHGAGLFLSIFLPSNSIVHEIKNANSMNNLHILSIMSGHKSYSDIINSYTKTINFNKYIFFNISELSKKILLYMKINNFF